MLRGIFITTKDPQSILSQYMKPPEDSDIMNSVLSIAEHSQDPNSFKPLIQRGKYFYCIKNSGEVTIILVIEGDASAILYVSYLEKIEEILHLYVEDPLTEFGVKDNFTTVYRVLDVFMDSNFPLAEDYNNILQFIPKKNDDKPQLSGIYPWRANNLTYRSQYFNFSVDEYFDYNMAMNGKINNLQIRGDVFVDAQVNETPRCSFTFRNSPVFDDISFHRCVDQKLYFMTKRIEFVPAHGKFTLLNYRLQGQFKSPVDINVSFTPHLTKVELKITVTANTPANDVNISFAIPKSLENTLIPTQGTFTALNDQMNWNIGKLKAGKPQELQGTIECAEICKCTAFKVGFSIPNAISSCEIADISVMDAPEFKQTPTVKYQGYSGNFQIRAGML